VASIIDSVIKPNANEIRLKILMLVKIKTQVQEVRDEAEDKKKRPRKKRGEVVQQTEAESELKDFIHRKNLMAERLSFLSKKQ
jgi:hypothetical protein